MTIRTGPVIPANLSQESLVGYWPLDGDGGPLLGEPALRGNLHQPAKFVTSPFGQALDCDGSKGFLEVPHHSSMDVGDGPFTVAAWIRPRTLRQSGIICLGGYGYTNGWLLDMPDSEGRLRIETATSQSEPNGTVQTAPGILKAHQWMHIAAIVQRGNNGCKLFVNGFEIAQGSVLWANLSNPSRQLCIGRIQDGQRFDGEIDEVWIFRRALAPSEIQLLVEPGRSFAKQPKADVPTSEGPSTERFATDSYSNESIPDVVNAQTSKIEGHTPPSWNEKTGFRLVTNDTVVFVGQTDMARATREASLELLLSQRFAAARPKFRSMAWEGDTVYQQWRDLNFGSWQDQLRGVNASVIIAQFGQIEALDGVKRVDDFIKAYDELLREFESWTRRIAIVSPHPFETATSNSAPDLAEYNDALEAYTRAIRRLAKERGYPYVELHELPTAQATSNGMHLTNSSHEKIAATIFRGLLGGNPVKQVSVTDSGLKSAIVEKNRLWFDVWRPMNWSFAFGDRTQQPFGKPGGGKPALRFELEMFKPLIEAADQRIALQLESESLAAGTTSRVEIEDHTVAINSDLKVQLAEPPITVNDTYDHSPQAELQTFQMADGFEVNLFASEKNGVVKPLQMRWDDRGRLWVLCAPTYPHIDPGAKPGDYVMICEDTDGDGQADQFSKFAEGLFIPMGIEFGGGGVYLCEASELVHLRDSDGDGKADQRRVILSGFGTADAHQMINSLCWGPDGSLFFSQGHHAYSHIETPWGISPLHKSGLWRYRPRSMRLDGFFNLSSAGLNCQGITYDAWGQVFHNSAAWSGGFYSVPGMIRTLRDAPYMALAVPDRRNTGIEFINTTHMPDNLQGAVAWGGFMSNAVQLHRFHPEGSGYYAEVLPDLMTSSREEFRPVNVRIGPDGGLYVCDWYNAIIGHYQASYRDPRRDRTRGRIWRVTQKGRPLAEAEDPNHLAPRELLESLRSDEGLVRYNARRRLFDLPSTQVVPMVETWLTDLETDDPLYGQLLIRGLGILQAHEALSKETLQRMLDVADPRTRAYAVHAIGHWMDGHDDRLHNITESQSKDASAQALVWLRKAVTDESPNVRLAAIVACSSVPVAESIVVAAHILDHPRDKFIDYAFYQCVEALKPYWYPAMVNGNLEFEGRHDHLLAVLELDGSTDVALLARKLWQSQNLTDMQREGLLDLLLLVGDGTDLRTAFEFAQSKPKLLSKFVAAANSNGKRPSGNLNEAVAGMLKHGRPEIRSAAIRLVGAWEMTELDAQAFRTAFSSQATTDELAAGLLSLPNLRGEQAANTLTEHADPTQNIRVQAAAIQAMTEFDLDLAASHSAQLLAHAQNEQQTRVLITPLLAKQSGASTLAKHIAPLPLQRDSAIRILRVLSAQGRNERELIDSVNKKLGVNASRREYDQSFVQSLVQEVQQLGDAARGRVVYQSQLGNCAACHRIDNQGGELGPDLSIVGKGRSIEQLLESILWPNRQVREGYMSTRVLCDDGGVYHGYRVRETKEALYLRDLSTGQIETISKERIERSVDAGSIMPENLTDSMTRDELRDLICFLSELGSTLRDK